MRRLRSFLFALTCMALPGAAAALCDVSYRVQVGDTLHSVAEFHYGDREKWMLIYYSNQGILNGGTQVVAGQDIFIPCPADGLDPAARGNSAASASTGMTGETVDLTLLTGGNYAPFTDKIWPEEGLATEIVRAALDRGPAPLTNVIIWEDDWSRHQFPLLDQGMHDMGFPWFRPDCDADPQNTICTRFHFSDPLMDVPMMLFKREGGSFVYESDADIAGAILCRPAGYSVYDLDRADRRWISEGVITLVQPESPEACFEELMAGRVDAVALNVFLGATKIVSMGLRGRAVPIDTPLSQEQLHVIISKSHWRGTAILYRINAGLAALRASGDYDDILERHLEIFWDQLK